MQSNLKITTELIEYAAVIVMHNWWNDKINKLVMISYNNGNKVYNNVTQYYYMVRMTVVAINKKAVTDNLRSPSNF